MSKITKEQYEFALERIEELLPIVTDERKKLDYALAMFRNCFFKTRIIRNISRIVINCDF